MDPRPGQWLYVVIRHVGRGLRVERRSVLECHSGSRPKDRAIVVTQDPLGRLEAWGLGTTAFLVEADAHARAGAQEKP